MKDLLNMDLEDFFRELEEVLQKNPGSVRIVLETAYQRGRLEVLFEWEETFKEKDLLFFNKPTF